MIHASDTPYATRGRMTREDQRRLFSRFARLSATPTGDKDTRFQPPSIVKQLVDLHGGQVWAEAWALDKAVHLLSSFRR